MAIWSSPKTKGVHGAFIDSDWKNLVSFLAGQGLLKEEVPVSRIYTSELIPEIDRFDSSAVRKQAKNFDLTTLK